MNSDQIEQWILLRQSGELSRRKSRQLDALLAQNPDLRQFQDDLQRLGNLSRASTDESSVPSMSGIIRARLLASAECEPKAYAIRQWDFIPALAAAALLLLGVGLWLHRAPHESAPIARTTLPSDSTALAWSDNLDAELNELQDALAGLGDTQTQTSLSSADEESILRELLELEGITI
ncbi:MAG: hypothetical protein M9963_04445 [Kiritimatiellae bacterium]|nr:hypothetical protein [Kiritimatiellia bacterium]